MTEERTVQKEVDVTFHYKVEKVVEMIDKRFKDEYWLLYVTIKDYDGKEFKFVVELGKEKEVEEILKELRRINNFYNFMEGNERIAESLREESLKRLALLIWKM